MLVLALPGLGNNVTLVRRPRPCVIAPEALPVPARYAGAR
jgi:hypothetical protein